MYNSGYNILLLPCKISESAIYNRDSLISPVTISIMDSEHDSNKFDRTVNEFEYYNCNAELGYYSHYYVSEHDFEKYNMCKLMCD